MSKWVFEISNELETFEVRPTGRENKIKWEREGDRVYDFKKSIDDLTFVGDDYMKFIEYNKNNSCLEQTLRIYQMCGLVRKLRFIGFFSMMSGKWNEDKCTVKFKIKEIDKYFCTKRKREYNIFDLLQPTQTAHLGATITFQKYACFLDGGGSLPSCDASYIEDNKWGFKEGFIPSPGIAIGLFLRLVLITPYYLGQSYEGWSLVSNAGTNYTYAIKYNEESHQELLEVLTLQGSGGLEVEFNEINNFKNGFNLYNVLLQLLNKNCPNTLIVSDFFQWNPENQTTINYVTGQPSRINNLKLFQKSDVKRPNASNSATKGESSFLKLLTDVLRTFNCGYFVNGNVLRIEHISWFEQSQNLDLFEIARQTGQITLNGTRKYSFDSTKLPKYENFEFMDKGSKEFAGTPIWYDNSCVEDDDDLAESKNNKVENISTDILHCLTNSNSSNSEVTDSGFVIAACNSADQIIWLPNILETGMVPNNVLAWTHLHRDFWKHGRVQIVGYMNVPIDEEDPTGTIFASSVSVKDQEPFKIQLCCSHIEEFNPLDFQNSTLGWGEVKSAELDLLTDMMSFELMFKQ